MNKKSNILFIMLWAVICSPVESRAQRMLNIDSCRILATRNNKKLNIARVNLDKAKEMRSAARTNYLPKIDALGTYQLTSREISLLSKDQQNALNNFGTNISGALSSDFTTALPRLVQNGTITAAQAQALSNYASQLVPSFTSALNNSGEQLRKALRTNTRNLFGADIMVRQPVYLGGSVKASNKIADLNINLANDNIDLMTQNMYYNVDQAYWLVVSLRQKQILSDEYLDLVKKLHSDVSKMLKEGIATRANELKVAVRVNEAEMTQTQVGDGLVLARMHLCQICGLELNSNIQLADEDKMITNENSEDISASSGENYDQRPELRMLSDAVDMSRLNTTIVRSAFLPQVFATGGYFMSNPNILNGYRNTFSGLFHVGLTLRVPIWNWGEGKHKIQASKNATAMAQLALDDMREDVELQVQQAEFRLKEAYKKLNMANHNLLSADENLRCANIGLKEGVMQTTDVMEAQTAWQSAHSQKIDAEIDVKMAQVNLRKAKGTLNN